MEQTPVPGDETDLADEYLQARRSLIGWVELVRKYAPEFKGLTEREGKLRAAHLNWDVIVVDENTGWRSSEHHPGTVLLHIRGGRVHAVEPA